MSTPRNWFRLPFVYRNRAERRESPALAAFHWDGPILQQALIANISASGAYVLTKRPWKAGDLVSLTLQRSGVLEPMPQRRFTVQAKAVRHDRNGVGLAFLLPRGADVQLWHNTLRREMPQTEPEEVVREFRMATAIAFIQRIAPAAMEQVRLLFREGLSNFRVESAVEIALHAEDLVAMHGERVFANPAVVLRILDDGSWAETEWIQHYWSGLLASSCTRCEGGNPDMTFPSLLSQLTAIQARLFTASCTRSRKFLTDGERVAAHVLTCDAEELTQIAGTHDLVHIERDVQHLVELGLVERRVKWKFFSLIEHADMTPTTTALELFARCKAFGGEPAEFYADAVAQSATFAAD